jgi:hypothetical protein
MLKPTPPACLTFKVSHLFQSRSSSYLIFLLSLSLAFIVSDPWMVPENLVQKYFSPMLQNGKDLYSWTVLEVTPVAINQTQRMSQDLTDLGLSLGNWTMAVVVPRWRRQFKGILMLKHYHNKLTRPLLLFFIIDYLVYIVFEIKGFANDHFDKGIYKGNFITLFIKLFIALICPVTTKLESIMENEISAKKGNFNVSLFSQTVSYNIN